MTTDQNRTQERPLIPPKLSNQRPPLREYIVLELEKFPVEVLQTVLLLLQSQQPDLETGT
jgi:hypothetical protein